MKMTCSTKCYSLHDNETLHPGIDRAPPPHRRRLPSPAFVAGSPHESFVKFYLSFCDPLRNPNLSKDAGKAGFLLLFPICASVGNLWAVCGEPRRIRPSSRKSSPIDHLPKLSHAVIPQCATDKGGGESFRNNKTKDAQLEWDWIQSDLAVSFGLSLPSKLPEHHFRSRRYLGVSEMLKRSPGGTSIKVQHLSG